MCAYVPLPPRHGVPLGIGSIQDVMFITLRRCFSKGWRVSTLVKLGQLGGHTLGPSQPLIVVVANGVGDGVAVQVDDVGAVLLALCLWWSCKRVLQGERLGREWNVFRRYDPPPPGRALEAGEAAPF